MLSVTSTKRVFIAMVPPPEAQKAFRRVAKRIAAKSGGRVVPEANIHMTLFFLGNQTETLISKLAPELRSLNFPPLLLDFDRLGRWPRPGIIWSACSATNDALMDVHQQCKALVIAHRLPLERRAFIPHITLIRKSRRFQPVEFEAISWQVDRVKLLWSRPVDGGVRYQELGSRPAP